MKNTLKLGKTLNCKISGGTNEEFLNDYEVKPYDKNMIYLNEEIEVEDSGYVQLKDLLNGKAMYYQVIGQKSFLKSKTLSLVKVTDYYREIKPMYFYIRLNAKGLEKLDNRKKNEMTMVKLKKLLLEVGKENVEIKTDDRYTDDYAHDNETNYGKTDYEQISDRDFNELIKDLCSGSGLWLSNVNKDLDISERYPRITDNEISVNLYHFLYRTIRIKR